VGVRVGERVAVGGLGGVAARVGVRVGVGCALAIWILLTKASEQPALWFASWNAFCVGKSLEHVLPVTYALRPTSTSTPVPWSLSLPARAVE
jgi:hypothetical protein